MFSGVILSRQDSWSIEKENGNRTYIREKSEEQNPKKGDNGVIVFSVGGTRIKRRSGGELRG